MLPKNVEAVYVTAYILSHCGTENRFPTKTKMRRPSCQLPL